MALLSVWRRGTPQQLGSLISLILLLAGFCAGFSHHHHGRIPNHNHNYTHSVSGRELTGRALAWEDAVRKGARFYCAMGRDDARAAALFGVTTVQSIWRDYNALGAHGWSEVEDAEPFYEDSLDATLQDLGASTTPDRYSYLASDKDYYVAGAHCEEVSHFSEQQFRLSKSNISKATGGFYSTAIFSTAGLLVADNNVSPQVELITQGIDQPPPELSRWSDVVFLEWINSAAGSELKGNIRSRVENPDTLSVMRRAVGKPSDFIDWQELGTIPSKGRRFLPNSNEFNALLGTPNLSGLCWLLIQHKEQLGVRQVSAITIFGTRNFPIIYAKIVEVG